MAKTSSRSLPRAILHFDGDAFFASIEQAMDFRLRHKPVITGGERGAATSLSYEAKARGLSRGMTMREIKIRCPEAIIVSSNYTAYSMYARRMYSIVRRYAPEVEEYSIDECFADITGLEAKFRLSYEDIALLIKEELETSLDVTFGVGLASTKTLAKLASKKNKPAGFTPLGSEEVAAFLQTIPIHYVWGFGGASGSKLEGLGVITAYDLASKEEWWLSLNKLGKHYRDIWLELRGESVKSLSQGENTAVGSLMRTRTFSPASNDRNFIISQLSKNVEDVCEKARRHGVRARVVSFYLKTQEFTYHGVSCELPLPSASPIDILNLIETRFDEVYASRVLYRASGVTLRGLVTNEATMSDLFGESLHLETRTKTAEVIDDINKKYGRHTVSLASSFAALTHEAPQARRKPQRAMKHSSQFKHKTLFLPYLGIAK